MPVRPSDYAIIDEQGTPTGRYYNPSSSTQVGSSSPVARYTTPPADPIAAYYENLNKTAPTPQDEATIRERIRSGAQASIDAITAEYTRQLTGAQEEGRVREAQTRGLNLAAGLVGSPSASANVAETRARNVKVEEAIHAEKQARIQAILGGVDERATKEIEARRLEAQGNANAYIKHLEESQTQARADIASLAQSGVDLQNLESDPVYQKLLTQSRYSPLEFTTRFNAAKKASERIDYKVEKTGDGFLLYGIDPRTNELTTKKIAMDIPQDFDLKIATDGTPILFNPKTGETKIAEGFKQGQFAKPVRTSGLTPNQQFQGGITLATKVDRLTAAAKEAVTRATLAQQAYDRYVKGETKDLNATTQVIINNFNKILDPASVVRESEYARSPAGQSLLANIEGKLNKLAQGGAGLTKESLKEFVDLGNQFAKNARTSIEQEKQRAIDYGKKFGIDTSYVGGGYVPPEEQEEISFTSVDEAASAPVGSVGEVNGYRVKKIGENDYQPIE